MVMNLQVRLFVEGKASWLCFRHAAKRAIEKNEEVNMEVDDFSSDNYMGYTHCVDCN